MKDKNERRLAEKIVELATYTVNSSVGKSFPLLAHEVKMPESVRKEFLKK